MGARNAEGALLFLLIGAEVVKQLSNGRTSERVCENFILALFPCQVLAPAYLFIILVEINSAETSPCRFTWNNAEN